MATQDLYYPAHETLLYCWDCEGVLSDAWEAAEGRCDTCARHAAERDDHEPVAKRNAFCHGAGPEGKTRSRMGLPPRALRWDETLASTYVD